MGLHRIFFPNCSQHEIARLRAELEAVTADRDAVKAELKREINWNRKLADRMVNFGLTKSGAFGIDPRPETPATAPAQIEEPKAEPAQDITKEAQIDARVIELEAIYTARGHNVPRPKIREMVEKNFVYLMDDDRVEI